MVGAIRLRRVGPIDAREPVLDTVLRGGARRSTRRGQSPAIRPRSHFRQLPRRDIMQSEVLPPCLVIGDMTVRHVRRDPAIHAVRTEKVSPVRCSVVTLRQQDQEVQRIRCIEQRGSERQGARGILGADTSGDEPAGSAEAAHRSQCGETACRRNR